MYYEKRNAIVTCLPHKIPFHADVALHVVHKKLIKNEKIMSPGYVTLDFRQFCIDGV